MANKRTSTKSILKAKIVPALRERGFTGSFPHFRRLTPTSVEVLGFQFDKWGSGKFVVEIAKCSPKGYTTHWGLFIPPDKITYPYLQDRLRLVAPDEQSDSWFTPEYLAKNYERIIELVDTQATKWWRAG